MTVSAYIVTVFVANSHKLPYGIDLSVTPIIYNIQIYEMYIIIIANFCEVLVYANFMQDAVGSQMSIVQTHAIC